MTQATTMTLPQPSLDLLCKHLDGLSSDNLSIRKSTEEQFNSVWLEHRNSDKLLASLCQVLLKDSNSNEMVQRRILAAILFRRMAFKSSGEQNDTSDTSIKMSNILWNTLNESSKKTCQASLLEAMYKDQNPQVKVYISDAIAEICRIIFITKEEWPELLTHLSQLISCPDENLHFCVLNILSTIPEIIAKAPQQLVQTIMTFLVTKLNQSSTSRKDLIVKAVDAIVNIFVESHKVIGGMQAMTTLIPMMWEAIQRSLSPINATDQVLTWHKNAISSLIKLAESSPKAFRPILQNLLDTTQAQFSNLDNEDIKSLRHEYVELVITLCECGPSIMAKKQQILVSDFVLGLFKMLACLQDDADVMQEWANQEDSHQEDDNDEDYAVAEQALDRISCALGCEQLLFLFISILEKLVPSNDWKQRHAAMMAISCIAEGVESYLGKHLNALLEHFVFPLTKDQHPMVRYSAAHALGQLSTDFGTMLTSKFHAEFFHYMLPLLLDNRWPRVQAHTAAAFINFINEMESTILKPYLDTVMPALFQCLNSARKDVQENAISTIATIAETCGQDFSPYYSTIMPPLLNVTSEILSSQYNLNPSTQNERKSTFPSRCIEAISIISAAVGKELFSPHAHQVIQLLTFLQDIPNLTDDDPIHEFLPSAWYRVCSAIGDAFLPYLDKVLVPLIRKAQISPKFNIIDESEMDDEEYAEGWYFYDLHGKKIAIHTSSLEEKADAIEHIGYYANTLGALFAPHCPSLLDMLIPVLKFAYHERVQIATARDLSYILDCMNKADPASAISIWYEKIAPALISGMTSSSNSDDVTHAIIASINSCFNIVGIQGITQHDFLSKFIQQLVVQMMSVSKMIKANPDKDDEDDQYQDIDDQSAIEDGDYLLYIVSEMTNCLTTIMKLLPDHKPILTCLLEGKVIPFYGFLLSNPKHDSSLRHDALCFFDALIEYFGPDALRLTSQYLRSMTAYLMDSDPSVMQAAIYGIGVCAKYGKTAFQSICIESIPILTGFLSSNPAEEFNLAKENAISSLSKIVLAFPNNVDLNSLLPVWLANLPVTQDEDEYESVYSFFTMLLEHRHAYIMANIQKAFYLSCRILAILLTKKVNKDVLDRLISASKTLFIPQLPQMEPAWQSLKDDEKRVITDARIFT